MNPIEEKIWNYIDGTCTPAEQEAIALLIEQDEVYRTKYQEFLQLNQEIAGMELDEPPMGFTYKVMETIRTENARQPLKAAINPRVIWGVSVFFAITIVTLLVFTIANIHIGLSAVDVKINMPAGFKLPKMSNIFSSQVFKWFLVFDVILALFLADSYLRRKKTAKQL
ncbi:hypothetical protein [Mucilaginibacter dorajii]|uniref:Transmembrane anti-sigma factor n=1 Tax=Mucilaginibacter dorajii TaxID=692994 RepID=A0ABP7PV73_9SPHI|nr:hypothetical protein [Mucilaginibacter dorajii]MCS3734954.1 hypothetical protein [Mucilaginibacter dorajii]